MQRGHILKHRGNWCLRYYEWVLRDGAKVRKKSFHRLAPVNKEYPTKRSVLVLAEKVLAPVNTGRVQPESSMTVAKFIENIYLLHVKANRKPSTYKDYKDEFEQLKDFVADLRLRDFRTVHAQRIVVQVMESTGVKGKSRGHKTGLRYKSFLSGAFKHAKRVGYIDGENPIRDVEVPGRAKKYKPGSYSIAEIDAIVNAVEDDTASSVIATAAFTGLRKGELQGLRWSDFDPIQNTLTISRSVWRTHVVATKTDDSEATIPVIPILAKLLNEYRVKTNGKDHDYIFGGERYHRPLNLANLARRVILPALAKAEDGPLYWRGWKAFRTGLAGTLYGLGVAPKVIQAILRHSDIGTTLAYYVTTPDAEMRDALAKVNSWAVNV
jgi:integrase